MKVFNKNFIILLQMFILMRLVEKIQDEKNLKNIWRLINLSKYYPSHISIFQVMIPQRKDYWIFWNLHYLL